MGLSVEDVGIILIPFYINASLHELRVLPCNGNTVENEHLIAREVRVSE